MELICIVTLQEHKQFQLGMGQNKIFNYSKLMLIVDVSHKRQKMKKDIADLDHGLVDSSWILEVGHLIRQVVCSWSGPFTFSLVSLSSSCFYLKLSMFPLFTGREGTF